MKTDSKGLFDFTHYKKKAPKIKIHCNNKGQTDIGLLGDRILISDCLVKVPKHVDDVICLLDNDDKNNHIPKKNLSGKIPMIFPLRDPGDGRDFAHFRMAVFVTVRLVQYDWKTVLIHCASGINRSAAVGCTVYAICNECSFQHALDILTVTRDVFPDNKYILMGQYLNRELGD